MTGLSQMDAKQYQDFLNETTADKTRTLGELQQLLIKTAEHWRAFTSTLLTIDVAVVAALLTVITSTNSNLIQTPAFSIIGILFLVIDAILIVYYSINILYNDEVALSGRWKFFEDTNDEVLKMAHDYVNQKKSFAEFDTAYLNKLLEFVKKERKIIADAKKKEKSGKWLLLLGYLFILGLGFAVFSVVPLDTLNLAELAHNLCNLH